MPAFRALFVLAGLPVLTSILVASGCGVSVGESRGRNAEKGPETAREDDPLVRLGEFTRGRITSELAVAADLEAVREADVPSQIVGVVRDLKKQEGDFVSRGDAVVLLDDDELELIHENKGILYEQAKTKAEQADLALRETQSLAEQKQLIVDEAEAAYRRLLSLAEGESGIISDEELEAKRYERDRARVDLKSISLQVEKNELEKTQAEQNMRLAEVELRTAALNLSRTVLVSPIDGFISKLELKPGEQVTTSTLVFQVVSLDELRARLHAPQKELRKLRVEQAVRITSDIYPGKSFLGEVSVINPVIDRENGTVTVLVDVLDTKGLLKPGMFVSGNIVVDVREDALLAPKRAINYDNQEPIVFLVEGETARRYTLTPGYSNKDHVEVLALTDMEGKRHTSPPGRLVLVGHDKLKDGVKVDIEGADTTALR